MKTTEQEQRIQNVKLNLVRAGWFTEAEADKLIVENEDDPERLIGRKSQKFLDARQRFLDALPKSRARQ